ncbi:TPA: hypothetical protein ACGPOD_002509 [Yersinia enterocolitica]|nr:hypothetical protein [Yersinia enterocolitica]HEN3319021.1 hypothetical protein [Yersinia enterocolitica]
MSEIKQYDTEVRLEAVMGTNHYGVHIHAMTTEDLHSKSGIAVELAWRDLRIEQLIAQLESAQKERDDLREKVNQADSEWHKMADRILSAGKRAEAAEAALSAANEKLSKPVVLPIKYNPAVAGNKSTRANFIWHNDAISYCADAIKAAGFTVEE